MVNKWHHVTNEKSNHQTNFNFTSGCEVQTQVIPSQVHKIHKVHPVETELARYRAQSCQTDNRPGVSKLVTMLEYWKGDHRSVDIVPPQIWSQSWSHRQRRDLLRVFLPGELPFNLRAAAASPPPVYYRWWKFPYFAIHEYSERHFERGLVKKYTDGLWFIGFLTSLPVQTAVHRL